MNKSNCNLIQSDPLPSPKALIDLYPLDEESALFINRTRETITRILNGEDQRLMLIVGPCSIHDIQAAVEYAKKLQALSLELQDEFLFVMRVYFDKPRTTTGWKGLMGDPHLDGSHSIADGLHLTRQLLLNLTKMRLPTAAEFLDPASLYYFSDLISWGCIGARTSESQTHRQMASALPIPIAFKNSTSGNMQTAINGMVAASLPQTFIGMNEAGQVARIRSRGNPHGHLALRGGEKKPNYDAISIAYARSLLKQSKLPERVIIDCSHDNSLRKYEQQIAVFQSAIKQIVDGEEAIRGLILESHLFAGNQPLLADKTKLKPAISLTDPCLDWLSTERLIQWAYDVLREEKKKRYSAKRNIECAVTVEAFPTVASAVRDSSQ